MTNELYDETESRRVGGGLARGGLSRGGVALATVGLLLLGACQESEQNRPLSYEPGVYLGQQDEPLDEGMLDQLRERARTGQQM